MGVAVPISEIQTAIFRVSLLLLSLGILYIVLWNIRQLCREWTKDAGYTQVAQNEPLTEAGRRSLVPPCAAAAAAPFDMRVPYEESDYDSDLDYITSVSSSHTDLSSPGGGGGGAGALEATYDMLEEQKGKSLPSSRRTSLVPPDGNDRRTSLIPHLLLENTPMCDLLPSPAAASRTKVDEARIHVTIDYEENILRFKVDEVRTNTVYDESTQMFVSIQLWRWDDSLHPSDARRPSARFHKKLIEFDFRTQSVPSSSKGVVKLRECFQCNLPAHFLYTATLNLIGYDSFSRHKTIGECHVVLRDVTPGKQFSCWLAAESQPLEERREILVSLCYLPTSERISLVVMKVRNVQPDWPSAPAANVYVRVTMLSGSMRVKTRRTSTKLSDNNPIFNESFQFDLPNNQINNVRFLLTVKKDGPEEGGQLLAPCPVRGAKTSVGHVLVGRSTSATESWHWGEMIANPRRPIAQWHSLHHPKP